MIAEENETPRAPRGDAPGGSGSSEGKGWRGEGDPLAERRARRAAEAPEHLLTLRAEAAEATVRTLESHLATVQQRLRDAEAEKHRLQEALVAEASTSEPADSGEASGRSGLLERELQRARHREQAEYRARVDAEDRAHAIERDERAEIDRLAQRLNAHERYVRALATQMQDLERRLLEAEERARAADERARFAEQRASAAEARASETEARASAAEAKAGAAEASAGAAEASATADVRARISALEHTAAEVGRGLARERVERERAERLILGMRRGQRRVEGLVRDLGTIVSRLRTQVTHTPPPTRAAAAAPRPLPGAAELAARGTAANASLTPLKAPARTHDRSAELESALEAAVERLRTRADGAPPEIKRAPEVPPETSSTAPRAPARPVAATARRTEREPAAEPHAPPLPAPRTMAPPARPGHSRFAPSQPPQAGPDPSSLAPSQPAQAGQAPARPAAPSQTASEAARVPAHKHSLSLIGRIRRARKQRRERR